MPQLLENLTVSLATVLIRYHDLQNTKARVQGANPEQHKKKSRELASCILQEPDFESKLTVLIGECTNQYQERLSLLNVIKNEIIELNRLSKREAPFSPHEFEEYKRKITQFFTDLRCLFMKRKDEAYEVEINRLGIESTKIPLCGFQNIGLSSYSVPVCASGVIIQGEVMTLFHLTPASPAELIKEIAEKICMEHQMDLLSSHIQHQTIEIGALKETQKELLAKIGDLERQQSSKEMPIDSSLTTIRSSQEMKRPMFFNGGFAPSPFLPFGPYAIENAGAVSNASGPE